MLPQKLPFKCCGFGEGSYRFGIDGENIFNSKNMQTFTGTGVHTFRVETRPTTQSLSNSVSWFIPNDSGFEADMSSRDNEWLTAHNIRRKRYHEEFGKTFVPLKWSPKLADEAKIWAIELLDGCVNEGILHEQNVGEGENLAKNEGEGKWGDIYPADSILTRWVERELDVGKPGNEHMTQVCPLSFGFASHSRETFWHTSHFTSLCFSGSLESVKICGMRRVR